MRTYAVKLLIEIKDYCTSFSFTSGSEEELPLESPFFALALPAAALEPVNKPLSIYGYTFYAIDSTGILWAWGDSFHGGITAERDPVDWEDAAAEMQNAVWTRGGFAVGLGIGQEGVLLGWGSDFAGALRGQDASRGAVPLLDRVVSAESDEGGVRALRNDGTLWSWNAENPPHSVMDHVRAYTGYWAVLEDGTVLELREEPRTVASHAAAGAGGTAERRRLVDAGIVRFAVAAAVAVYSRKK